MNNYIKNLKLVAVSIICFYIAYITGTGEVLNYIPFADPLNELTFFGLSSMMGVGSLCLIKK